MLYYYDILGNINCNISVSDDRILIYSGDVTRVFKNVCSSKATGPDGMSCFLLKTFAKELTPAWHHLFQLSIDTYTVPELWKKSIIILIPKKSCPQDKNDYRPVALTLNVMKSFEKIIIGELCKEVEPSLDHFFFFDEVSESEIISTVSKLKSKHSCDSDGLDMYIVKETICCIIGPLKYLINLSFKTGFFPDKMKVAKIIPLFKSGDRHSLTNYRPISLLSQFSNILEKLFVKKCDYFLEKHSLIHDNQFGFQSTRFTAMALMKITEDIITELENKNHTVGVFIDLKKAFDTLDHGILISKLQTYGIRGVVLNWIISYLENRQQYVEYIGHESKLETIQCGVPQGSVLGPKLFTLHINDLCDESKILRFVLFADDTIFFVSRKNLKILMKTIEQELFLLQKWFNKNKLIMFV